MQKWKKHQLVSGLKKSSTLYVFFRFSYVYVSKNMFLYLTLACYTFWPLDGLYGLGIEGEPLH